MKELPQWLSAKNLYIAERLIAKQGFSYSGHADNFCEGYFLERFGDWDIFSPYGGLGLDAVCNEALFSLDLEDSEISAEEIIEHTKQMISLLSYQWEHNSPVHRQLELNIEQV